MQNNIWDARTVVMYRSLHALWKETGDLVATSKIDDTAL